MYVGGPKAETIYAKVVLKKRALRSNRVVFLLFLPYHTMRGDGCLCFASHTNGEVRFAGRRISSFSITYRSMKGEGSSL